MIIRRGTKNKCFKCGIKEGTLKETLNHFGNFKRMITIKLINHHISYDPEVIVLCCRSCHNKIHITLRKEGKCIIPPIILRKLNSKSECSKQILQKHHKKQQQKTRQKKTRPRDLKRYKCDINHDLNRVNML